MSTPKRRLQLNSTMKMLAFFTFRCNGERTTTRPTPLTKDTSRRTRWAWWYRYLIKKADSIEKNVERNDLYKVATQHMVEKSFIDGLASVVDKEGNLVWEYAIQPVKNPFYFPNNKNSHKKCARICVLFSGEKTAEKKDLANRVLKEWQQRLE